MRTMWSAWVIGAVLGGGCLDSSLKKACKSDGDCLNGYACVQLACTANAGIKDSSLQIDMTDPVAVAETDLQPVSVDMAPGCRYTMGVTSISDMSINGCSIQGTCQGVTYAISCDGTVCQCLKNSVLQQYFAQPQACQGGTPDPWLGAAWLNACSF